MLIFFLDEKFLFIYLEDKNNHKYGENKIRWEGQIYISLNWNVSLKSISMRGIYQSLLGYYLYCKKVVFKDKFDRLYSSMKY